MTKKYDVVIVGGGAAGLTCAWRLSKKTDADIALLEKKEHVGRNVTPGTLNMEFVNRLKRWGFSGAVERMYTRLGLYTTDESAKFDLEGKPIGASINYGKFCRLLAGKSSVDIFTGTKAEKLERTSYGIRINDEFDAKLVMDASGAALLTQKKTNARLPGKYFIVQGARFSGCSIKDHSEFSLIVNSSHGTGGGWLYPLRHDEASFGIAFLEDSPDFDRHLAKRGFKMAANAFTPFSDYLRNAKVDSVECGVIPVEPLENISHDRTLLVGDAAGHAFPVLGEGLRPTVDSAILCSEFAASSYESNDFSARRLKLYETEWKKRNQKRYLMEQVSRDVSFGRTADEWSDFLRKIRKFHPEMIIPFISGELQNRKDIRKSLPMKEALKAAMAYLRYKIFHRH